MARVLVTGGAGFIGSKIAEECVRRGLKVRLFDLKEHKIKGVDESWVGSILDPYSISRAARDCQYIVHAAAALGVQRTETRRLECLYINIQGTINVLDAAVKEHATKILLTSSSEVYGDQDAAIYAETTNPAPKSNYAITKLVGEEYLRAYRQSYGLDYSVVRFFNVYGENQVDQFVMSRFVNAVARNESPLIYGEGNQIRCFCYVDDAAKGAAEALLSKKGNSQTFNIGNDSEPITMRDLAKRVIRISGKNIEARRVHYKDSDREEGREIFKRVPSIEKAKQILKYNPQVSLDEGLRRMLKVQASSPQELQASKV